MAYPDTIDTFVTLVDNVDTVLAAHPNDRGSAITNVETALGTNLKNVLPRDYLYGGLVSNNSSDADHDLDISALECRDDGNSVDIILGAFTKLCDATFAEGTGNGGMQSGLLCQQILGMMSM